MDEQGVEDIRALLLELRDQGKTILLSSHNREDIDLLCDSVCKMAGEVLTKALKASPRLKSGSDKAHKHSQYKPSSNKHRVEVLLQVYLVT